MTVYGDLKESVDYSNEAKIFFYISHRYEWKHALLYYERDGQYNVAGEHTCHLLMQTIAKLFRSLNLSFSSFPTDQAGNNNVTETLRKKVGLHESSEYISYIFFSLFAIFIKPHITTCNDFGAVYVLRVEI